MEQRIIHSLIDRIAVGINEHEKAVSAFKSMAKWAYSHEAYKHATQARKEKEWNQRQVVKLVEIQKALIAELKAQKKPKVSKKHGKGEPHPHAVKKAFDEVVMHVNV